MADRRCAAITRGGKRCQRIATEGSAYCYSHDPDRSEERSRNASKAGKAGGNGRPSAKTDVAEARSYTKGLISGLLKGNLARDTATGAFMGLNTLARLIELERKIIEQDELMERLEALERREAIHENAWRSHR